MNVSDADQRWSHQYRFKGDLNHYSSNQTYLVNWHRENYLRWQSKLDEIDKNEKQFKDLLFTLFQIDLENWAEIEFVLIKNLQMRLDDIDKMAYYRVQDIVDKYKDFLEKEKERQDK